jgi:DNA-binding transcriptional regulator YiaG
MRKKKPLPHHYIECGLRNVWLLGVDVFECLNSECNDEGVIVPQLDQLHDAIARKVASQEQKLLPQEIRFLRTYLGFSGADFARYISVSPETVSRWENGNLKISETSCESLSLPEKGRLETMKN